MKYLKKYFNNLAKRITKHRTKCKGWQKANPCFDCHYNTLTKIEVELEDLQEGTK